MLEDDHTRAIRYTRETAAEGEALAERARALLASRDDSGLSIALGRYRAELHAIPLHGQAADTPDMVAARDMQALGQRVATLRSALARAEAAALPPDPTRSAPAALSWAELRAAIQRAR